MRFLQIIKKVHDAVLSGKHQLLAQLNLWVVFVCLFVGVCDYDLRSEIFSYR